MNTHLKTCVPTLTPGRLAAVIAVGTLLTACGGGGGGSSSTPPVPNQSAGGIWIGTDTLSGGKSVVGIITETGEFHFIASGPVQYVGQLTTTGDTGSGTFDGYAQFGTTFADGSTHGHGTVTGTVQQRVSLSAGTQFTTDNGAVTSDSLTLSFSSLYNRASDLSVLAGNFTSTTNGIVFSVTSTGVITAQDATTGCVLNGAASIINASYNVYSVSLSYANCTGQYAAFNGGQLKGVGTLDNTGSPEQFIVAVSGTVGPTRVAVTDVLNRT